MGNTLLKFTPGRFSVVTKRMLPIDRREQFPQFSYDLTDTKAEMDLVEVVATSGHEDDDEYKEGDICLVPMLAGFRITLGKIDYYVFDIENIIGKIEENSYDD